jgi:hypothetical protein
MSIDRFPGPKPFSEKDSSLFFGREEEKSNLINQVKINRLNVLFGRSGNGKSSLIHAGLIPYYTSEQYKIIEIRLQSFQIVTSPHQTLKSQVILELKNKRSSPNIYLHEILPESNTSSMWQHFKTLQWEATKEGLEGVILIIDQFEELFNFPQEQYKVFADELSELIYNRTPYRFQEAIDKTIKDRNNYISENQYLFDFVKNEIFSSFLIGIRSDRLYLLDELGDVIPVIFNNRIRLGHLDLTKINDVIKKPAELLGDFSSPTFEIKDDVIKDIKDYLLNGPSNQNKHTYIEAFQLQIICQYIEQMVIKISKRRPNTKVVIDKSKLSKPVSTIIKDYYESTIKKFNSTDVNESDLGKLLCIRYFIERKLIDNKTHNRICLDKTSVYPLGIGDVLLKKLLDSKIIRKETNTVSGESYEISHDSLVNPILSANNSEGLGILKTKLYDYYSKATSDLETRLWITYRLILSKAIDKGGNITRFYPDNKDKNQLHCLKRLVESNIFVKGDTFEGKRINDLSEFYFLNETFKDVVLKKQSEYNVRKQKLFVGVFILLIVIIWYFAFINANSRLQHKVDASRIFLLSKRELFNPPNSNVIDTILPVKKLLLLTEIYETLKESKKVDTATVNSTGKALTSYFNSFDFIGKRISERGKYALTIKTSENKLLVIYVEQRNKIQKKDTKYAYIYDQYGGGQGQYKDIVDADFGVNSEVVILKKDSLIFHEGNAKPDRKVILDLSSLGKLAKGTLSIDSIKTAGIFGQINLKSQDSNVSGGESADLFQNAYYVPLDSKKIIIDYDGKANLLQQSGVKRIISDINFSGEPINILNFGGKSLIRSSTTLSLKDNTRKYTSETLITGVYFSQKSDSIFVNDGQNITILDNELRPISKFKNTYNINIPNNRKIFAYIQSGTYIVLVNLQDPVIKSIQTLDAESVYNYITKGQHTVTWSPPLTIDDKKKLGFDEQ